LFAGGRLGTGFNPVIGPVEIQVDQKDVEKAKELLSQIEHGEFELSETDAIDDHVQKSEYSPTKRHKVKGLLMGIVIGIILSGIAFYIYDYRERHFSGVLKYDKNRDLKPDLLYTYKNGTVVREEQDRNFDGRIDLWVFYKDGSIERAESDDNFDGRVGTWYYYRNGVVTRGEIDANFDNKPEIIEEFTNGVLSAMSWYHESSRNLWKKAYFVGGIKKEEYIDLNYDGTFDIKMLYDSSERAIRTDSLR
jgi:antitoxin component YwqK of YwqJK toxin-antitoxin module